MKTPKRSRWVSGIGVPSEGRIRKKEVVVMNNPVLENLKTRRSIRKYLPRQVEPEKLDLILEAGTYAPTGMGMQSPVIIAVQDPQSVQKLAKLNAKVMNSSSNPYYDAPTILLVLASSQRGTRVEDGSRSGFRACAKGRWLENMMLAAHSLGLGSCWIHREREMFELPEGKELLSQWGITEPLTGVGALALGYPDGDAPQPKPRKEGDIVKVL